MHILKHGNNFSKTNHGEDKFISSGLPGSQLTKPCRYEDHNRQVKEK